MNCIKQIQKSLNSFICSPDDKKNNNCINSETLGFRLASLKTIIYNSTKDSPMLKVYLKDTTETLGMTNFGFITSLIGCFYDKQDSDFDLQSDIQLNRTIMINNNNVSMFKFNLSNIEKKDLIAIGHINANTYLKDPKNILNMKEKNKDNRGYYKAFGIFGVGVLFGVGIILKLINNN